MGTQCEDATAASVTMYQPVIKMQQKAAALRAELQAAGAASPAAVSKLPGHLNLQIPDADNTPSAHAPTPANPRFKPNRPFASKLSAPSDDPFTPLGRPPVVSRIKSGHSLGRHASTSDTGTFHTRPSLEDGGVRPTSPTSSVNSRLLGSSLSPKKSGAPSTIRSSLAAQEAYTSLASHVSNLEAQVDDLKIVNQMLQEDLDRRQDSYMRREDELQTQITKLQAELADARGERSTTQEAKFGKATESIQQLHGQMVNEIEALLSKQAISIKYEEQTQTRRLKNKLSEVEAELVTERGATNRAASEWMNRTQALRQELDTVQDIANKLDAMYKLSEEECRRLRSQFKCQEDDREYLVRQVVNLKKENKRLAVELAAMAADAAAVAQERDEALQLAQAQGIAPGGAPIQSAWPAAGNIDKDTIQVKVQRYEDVIESLKKLCEAERRRTRQARAAHTAELASRTELQTILRQCVDDVRLRATQAKLSGTRQLGSTSIDGGQAGVLSRLPRSLSSSARPVSAMPLGRTSIGRPNSALPRGPAGALWARGMNRPMSAAITSTIHQGGVQHGAGPDTGMLTAESAQFPEMTTDSSGVVTSANPLTPTEREELIRILTHQETLLLQLLQKSFPGVAPPTLPGNTAALDHLAAVREQRDATVVANARALAAARGQASGNAGRTLAFKDGTPGSEVAKEAAGKPWVFSVDAMLQDFLQA